MGGEVPAVRPRRKGQGRPRGLPGGCWSRQRLSRLLRILRNGKGLGALEPGRWPSAGAEALPAARPAAARCPVRHAQRPAAEPAAQLPCPSALLRSAPSPLGEPLCWRTAFACRPGESHPCLLPTPPSAPDWSRREGSAVGGGHRGGAGSRKAFARQGRAGAVLGRCGWVGRKMGSGSPGRQKPRRPLEAGRADKAQRPRRLLPNLARSPMRRRGGVLSQPARLSLCGWGGRKGTESGHVGSAFRT